MGNSWLSIAHIEKQEQEAKVQAEQFFGKGKSGFCDFALSGIELMLQATSYLRNNDALDESGNFKGFNEALRFLAHLHYYTTAYTFKACYNLALAGYLTEAAVLLRQILETFVRLRYIEKKREIKLVMAAFAGHHGWEGKKRASYRTQFDEVSPGLYRTYQILCDIAHGASAAHVLKEDWSRMERKELVLDTGIAFKPLETSFILNQFSVYLLAHLKYMFAIFPEINAQMPEEYASEYNKTVETLSTLVEQMAANEKNKQWIERVKGLLQVSE